jgi:hypothetical protein
LTKKLKQIWDELATSEKEVYEAKSKLLKVVQLISRISQSNTFAQVESPVAAKATVPSSDSVEVKQPEAISAVSFLILLIQLIHKALYMGF